MMESHEYYLKRAIEVSKRSRENGNTPFGAILVDGEGNILLEQAKSPLKSVQDMQRRLWQSVPPSYIQSHSFGTALYILQPNHVQCVQVPYIGQISATLYMQ